MSWSEWLSEQADNLFLMGISSISIQWLCFLFVDGFYDFGIAGITLLFLATFISRLADRIKEYSEG